ncbi:MAG: T9SS type A sorting domain-containing protein [Bacteroidota bacterium]
MKKTLFLFIAVVVLSFVSARSYGQCTPDPLVTDPEGNGEMVPDTLEAIETVPLSQTLTIIGPDTANIGAGTITIHHVTVKSLQNKPSWLSYACNPSNCEFVHSQARCVLTTGTPPVGSAGYYPVTVLVDVYVSILGTPVAVATDYNSGMPLVVWVHPASFNVSEFTFKDFGVIAPKPNPFVDATKIGCYTETAQNVSLKIIDVLGKVVYNEKMNANAGENYFSFTGSNLTDGIYLYSIIDQQNRIITKKFIKSN